MWMIGKWFHGPNKQGWLQLWDIDAANLLVRLGSTQRSQTGDRKVNQHDSVWLGVAKSASGKVELVLNKAAPLSYALDVAQWPLVAWQLKISPAAQKAFSKLKLPTGSIVTSYECMIHGGFIFVTENLDWKSILQL